MKLTKNDNQPAEIVNRVFLGSIGCAFNKESLQRNGITHILTCADKIQSRFPSVRKNLAKFLLGFQIHGIAYP